MLWARSKSALIDHAWFQQFHTYDGIGAWLTFGKEWRGRRTGVGLGIDIGYIRTLSEPQDFTHLGIMEVLTMTAR